MGTLGSPCLLFSMQSAEMGDLFFIPAVSGNVQYNILMNETLYDFHVKCLPDLPRGLSM